MNKNNYVVRNLKSGMCGGEPVKTFVVTSQDGKYIASFDFYFMSDKCIPLDSTDGYSESDYAQLTAAQNAVVDSIINKIKENNFIPPAPDFSKMQ